MSLNRKRCVQCQECGSIHDGGEYRAAIDGLQRQITDLQSAINDPARRSYMLNVFGVSFTDMLTDMKQAHDVLTINLPAAGEP